jgi:hypothetical protein
MKNIKALIIISVLAITLNISAASSNIKLHNFSISESEYSGFNLISFNLKNSNKKISIDSKKEWNVHIGNKEPLDILIIETKRKESIFSLQALGDNISIEQKKFAINNTIAKSSVNPENIKNDYMLELDSSIYFFLKGDISGYDKYPYTIVGIFNIEETTFLFIELFGNLDHADEFYTMKTSIKNRIQVK